MLLDEIKISIVTVTRDNLAGLRRTYESIPPVESEPLLEWIVVDGQSSDETVAYLSSLKDERLTWSSEADSGIFNAMNKGIARSTGAYVIFMNAGDRFYRGALRSLANLLARTSPQLVFGQTVEESQFGDLFLKPARKARLVVYSMPTHHQSIVFSRGILGSGYDESYKYSADWALVARLIRVQRVRVAYHDGIISIFERGGISQQKKYRKVMNDEHLRLLKQNAQVSVLTCYLLWFSKRLVNKIKEAAPMMYDGVRFKRQSL